MKRSLMFLSLAVVLLSLLIGSQGVRADPFILLTLGMVNLSHWLHIVVHLNIV